MPVFRAASRDERICRPERTVDRARHLQAVLRVCPETCRPLLENLARQMREAKPLQEPSVARGAFQAWLNLALEADLLIPATSSEGEEDENKGLLVHPHPNEFFYFPELGDELSDALAVTELGRDRTLFLDLRAILRVYGILERGQLPWVLDPETAQAALDFLEREPWLNREIVGQRDLLLHRSCQGMMRLEQIRLLQKRLPLRVLRAEEREPYRHDLLDWQEAGAQRLAVYLRKFYEAWRVLLLLERGDTDLAALIWARVGTKAEILGRLVQDDDLRSRCLRPSLARWLWQSSGRYWVRKCMRRIVLLIQGLAPFESLLGLLETEMIAHCDASTFANLLQEVLAFRDGLRLWAAHAYSPKELQTHFDWRQLPPGTAPGSPEARGEMSFALSLYPIRLGPELYQHLAEEAIFAADDGPADPSAEAEACLPAPRRRVPFVGPKPDGDDLYLRQFIRVPEESAPLRSEEDREEREDIE